MDRPASLQLTPCLAVRTRFYPESDRLVIGTIRCGVLFVMAFWSAPSRKAFVELKRVFDAVDPERQLELVVLDTDGCPDLYEVPEFVGKLHGAGEAAWVRDGRIVRTSGLGFHPDRFEPFTTKFLEECMSGLSSQAGD